MHPGFRRKVDTKPKIQNRFDRLAPQASGPFLVSATRNRHPLVSLVIQSATSEMVFSRICLDILMAGFFGSVILTTDPRKQINLPVIDLESPVLVSGKTPMCELALFRVDTTISRTMRVKHIALVSTDDDNMLPMVEVLFPSSDIECSDEEVTLDAISQASTKDSSVPTSVNKQQLIQTHAVARFLPNAERSFTEQMNSLSGRERSCVMMLRQQWETDNQPIPGIVFLRFARFNNFNIKASRKSLSNFDKRYLTMTVARLGPMLQTKVRSVFFLPYLVGSV